MEYCYTCNSAACIYQNDLNTILAHYQELIRSYARKYVPRPRGVPTDELEKDIDDLAQLTLIKLWLLLENNGCCHIQDMNAYIRRMVQNEAVNLARRYKPTESLLTNNEGEIAQTYTLVASSLRAQDPYDEVEQAEMFASYSSKVPQAVLTLPQQQQRAMICALKDRIADILPLTDMFQPYGIDIDAIDWPEEENELKSMYSSLSVARKKFRASRKNDPDWY